MFNQRKQVILSLLAVTFLMVGCSSEKSYILDLSKDQPAQVESTTMEGEFAGGMHCALMSLSFREVNLQLMAEGREDEIEGLDSDSYSQDDTPARFMVDNGKLRFLDYEQVSDKLSEESGYLFQLSGDSTMLKLTDNENGFSCLFPIKEA